MNIKTHIVPTTFLPPTIAYGYGNGYIGVPPEHPWFNRSYNDIDVDVHGGLTYSDDHAPGLEPDGYWWIGFDTNHYQDNKYNCDEAYVQNEVLALAEQAIRAL